MVENAEYPMEWSPVDLKILVQCREWDCGVKMVNVKTRTEVKIRLRERVKEVLEERMRIRGDVLKRDIDTYVEAAIEDMDWSPDGNKVVFSVAHVAGDPGTYYGNDLWLVNADGTGLTRLTNTYDIEERNPLWVTPDEIVVFCEYRKKIDGKIKITKGTQILKLGVRE